MNKVDQAICRIREKLPNNQGFATLGVGCVVKNEELAASLEWKCPNLILTSSAVITPEHLALDRIFLADFLVFEKKGFEVFDLKLASEFCRTVSSRALTEEEVQQLPNERLTVISTEPLDKRGFLKRMVKKSSLQTTRPLDCFNFQNLDNELLADGIFCNVIREYGSQAQDFETRTYKFRRNDKNHKYFLEDFNDQAVKMDVQSFPADLNPLGGVIFSKLGAYVGCLGYGKTQIEPAFVPSSLFQGVEEKEDTHPEEVKEKETESLVEGAATVNIESKEEKTPTDENKNTEKEGMSVGKDTGIPVEGVEEKTTPEEKKESNLEGQASQSNEQEIEEAPKAEELQEDQGSGENSENIEKEVSGEEELPEKTEPSEAGEQETSSKEINNESEVSKSETVEENVDVNKEEEDSSNEFVTPSIESSEKESQDVEESTSDAEAHQTVEVDVEGNDVEKDNLEHGDSIPQDMEASTSDKENEEISSENKEQTLSQDIDNELTEENKDASEDVSVTMETNQHVDEDHEEEPKTEDGLEPDVTLLAETEVKNNDDEITQPESSPAEIPEVKDLNDPLEVGKESSIDEKNADIEADQVNIDEQSVETDEGKVNDVKSVMEEDKNILVDVTEAENAQDEETVKGSLAPTLEEELDLKIDIKRRKSKSEEVQPEGGKEENVQSKPEKEETQDAEISPEIAEKDSSSKEISLDDKTEEIVETDKPDGPGVEVEVLKLEPMSSPRKAEDDVGESLEPDALLSATITNNPKVLDDLAILLDTEYQHGGVASWHDMALLLDIPKEAFDHCLSYSKSSPTESLLMFLSNTKPQFTVGDLKDSLRSIGRIDVVHILDRYIARSVVSNESVILGVVERDDTDLLGELALKLDRSGPQNWKLLASELEIPRRISKHFGAQQRQNPALLMLKYLPIFDPDLTVQSLKDACEAISKFDVVKFLDTSGVPGDDAIMDILEDTDIIDEISDMLNDDEVVPNWKDLARELKIPEVKFSIFEPAAKKSPTKLLLQSIEQCEPDITVEELILALVAMKRHDVIDMLHKHFKRSDIRSILEENNCLPPEPQPEANEEEKESNDDDGESSA